MLKDIFVIFPPSITQDWDKSEVGVTQIPMDPIKYKKYNLLTQFCNQYILVLHNAKVIKTAKY